MSGNFASFQRTQGVLTLQLNGMTEDLVVLIGYGQLDIPDLVHTKRSYVAAEGLERANLDRFTWNNVDAANRIVTLLERFVKEERSSISFVWIM